MGLSRLKQLWMLMVLDCSCRGNAAITDTSVLRFDPTNLTVLEGDSGTLTCNISNSDPGVYFISWKDSVSNVYHPQDNCRVTGPLTNTQDYNVRCINEDVQITILNVSRDRHGEVWICKRVIFANYYESSSIIFVRVPITNVRLETQSEYTKTKENTSINFVCVTSIGYPEAIIRWYKNSTHLTNNDVSTSSTTFITYLKVVRSTLTLHMTRADNSSKIYCAAKNNDTTWIYSSRTSVIVYYAPSVPIITKGSRQVQGDLEVKEGNEVNMKCTASSFPESNQSWIIPNGTNIDGEWLHITNISRSGGGNYTCKSINTMRLSSGKIFQGENKTSIIVHVLYPPSQPMIKYMKSNSNIQNNMINKLLNVLRNDNFTLTCTTDSKPSSSYRWTSTGNHTIQETNTNTLTVVSIQDDMNLTCTATNTIKETFGMTATQSANSTISIIVLYPPRNPEFRATNGYSHVQENISNVNVKEGDTITVTCQADSRPTPYGYYWSVDSYMNNAAMRLTNVKRTQTGNYSCEARNRMNRTFGNPAVGKQSNSINIIVLYPPSSPTFIYNNISGSIITDRIVKVIKGKSVKVVCNTTGNPIPVYNWYNTAETPGQLLEVINIANDTTWTCRVTNNMTDSFGIHDSGEAKRELSLNILYPPDAIHLKVNGKEPTTNNNTARVVEGSNVTLSCDAISKPPPSTYTWSNLMSATMQTDGTGEYNIVSINRTQAGRYKCLVEFVIHPSFEKLESGTISKNLSLEVLYPTKIDSFMVNGHTAVNVTVNEKDNITFVCNVEGKPESNVSILHEGIPLKHAKVMNNVNHTVTNVTCVQHGQYACAANNMYNTEHPINYLTLFVRCSPRPTPYSELQEVFASALYVDTTISFEVLAYPAPTGDDFKWEKEKTNGSSWKEVENNENILVSSYGVQSNLTLKNVSRLSFGNYRFTVTNSVGTYRHQFVLKAEAAPVVNPFAPTSIIPIVSGVAASVVVICVTVVIVVLYQRRQNQKKSLKRRHDATPTNVSRGVYENVCSDRNDDANKDGTDNKSNIYQNVPDLHLPSSATSSKQSSSVAQEAATPVPSEMIYENLMLKAF